MNAQENLTQEMALSAREISTVVEAEMSRANPTETIVFERIAVLAQSIERTALQALSKTDRRELDWTVLVSSISMLSGILHLLSLVHR